MTITRRRQHSLILLALVYLSFVSLGLPDGLNGVAWPSIRAYFNLPLNALGSLLVMFTAGYLASSFLSGRLMALMSLGTLLALSCLAASVSLIGYAVSPAWWVMVALGAIAGLGAGGIDAGLNTFAAVEFSPRGVNWLHACYGVGAATGPVIMTRVLAANHPWQQGYAIVGAWQLLLTACFGLTRRMWPPPSGSDFAVRGSAIRASNSNTLRLPIMWLSIAVFFIYTGVEAAAGIWSYTLFTESRGVSIVTAGLWVTVYWAGLTVGRLVAGVALGYVSANRLMRFHVGGMAVGAALIWLNASALVGFLGLATMGFASASVFPCLIATTPGRLGPPHTSNGIGFQIAAAALGQSLLPAFTGVLAGRLGLEIIGPALFVACMTLLGLILVLTSTKPEINGSQASLEPIGSDSLPRS